MMNNATRTPGWSTSSHGEAAEQSPAELLELKKQLDACSASRSSLFRLQCTVERLSGMVANRLVTTVFLVVFLLVIGRLIANL